MTQLTFVTAGVWGGLFSAAAAEPARKAAGDPAVSRAVDAEIDAALKAKDLVAAPPADDAEFCRRAYLDLLGRIPTVKEAQAYLDDRSADKRGRLIDALLTHPETPLHWRDVIHHWLNGRESKPGLPEFRAWLYKSLERNKPWDVTARELVLPDGENPDQAGAVYFLTSRLARPKDEQLDAITTAVSAGLFGVRLECAKCHDHPMVDDWKQDHYYGLASFFNRTQAARAGNRTMLKEGGDSRVTFTDALGGQKTAVLMFLDGKTFDDPAGASKGAMVPKEGRRKILAEYAFTPDNPFFKKAVVNRVWKQLMGRGLVEPVDQMHSANPPTHPKVLQLLADDFAAAGFDLHRLIANIMHTRAYGRASAWKGARPPASTYAAANLKPLSPEQLGTSIFTATGHADVIRAKAKPKDSATAPEIAWRMQSENDLKPFIERYDSEAGEFQATSAQALFLTFNTQAQKLLHPAGGLSARLAKTSDDREVARAAFLAILSRRPTDDEIAGVVDYLVSAKGPRDQRVRDVVWALVTGAEFRFNH